MRAISIALMIAMPLTALAQSHRQQGSRPATHLSPLETADFFLGQALFERPWANGLSSSSSSDGLGPLFNARACSSCHADGGRGDMLVDPDWDAPNLVIEVLGDVDRHPVLGRQLQSRASPGLMAEGTRRITTEINTFLYPDGQRVDLLRPFVEVTLTDPATSNPAGEASFAPRVAPPLWASSRIEAVPEAQILAWADPEDLDSDGISGRVRWSFSLATASQLVGRFGWKATAPTLEDQIANAFATDMGLSNRLLLADQGDCTAGQTACIAATAYADDPDEAFEVREEIFDLVVGYNRGLASPAFAGDDVLHADGIALFDDVGCNACHRHEGGSDAIGATPPFTDLLLHDMGPGLADVRPQGSIGAAEWRTAPLIGLHQSRISNSRAGYLHDGRAPTVEQAVLWHDGEARAARDRFTGLSEQDRRRLLEFLENL